MESILFIFLLLIIVIFLVALGFKNKHKEFEIMSNGTCPKCGAEKTSFKNEEGEIITKTPIQKLNLQTASCTPGQIAYICKECNYKGVFSDSSSNCSI